MAFEKRPPMLTSVKKPGNIQRDEVVAEIEVPQTPLASIHPPPMGVQWVNPSTSIWLKWATDPVLSLKLILIPPFLYALWAILAPLLFDEGLAAFNPFGPIFILTGYVPESNDDDPRYAKTWFDLIFIAYYIVFFSFTRQAIAVNLTRRLARAYRIRKERKIERLGEQLYAVIYFSITSVVGYKIMCALPTNWYRTAYFWIDYPHWDMQPELKRYYLMQMAYWAQQLLVLVAGLERPRSDYDKLVVHHAVTIWLVGTSYLFNLTHIGNAVYLSMDIPDIFLALSHVFNYLRYNGAKTVSFVVLLVTWTYFRHYQSIAILYSICTEFYLVPTSATQWSWEEGTYLPSWMKYQVFAPLLILQGLNLFWYFLILRILVRTIRGNDVRDDREDDEEEEEPAQKQG